MNKPLEKYIKRHAEVETLHVRISPKVKHQAESVAKKLNTSMARFSEAALTWYLEALKKQGEGK